MTKHPPETAVLENIFGPIITTFLSTYATNDSEILHEPRTYHRRIELDFEEAAKRVTFSPENLQVLFTIVRDALPSTLERAPKIARNRLSEFSQQFAGTPEYHSFSQLVDGAWSENPTEVVQTFKQFDRKNSDNRLALAVSLLSHAEKQKGELRAEYTIHAAKRVSESLYQPFMRSLLRLFYIASKRGLSDSAEYYKMDYGLIYSHLRGNKKEKGSRFRDIYPNLLYQHAVLIRNAEAHENWDYYFDTDKIEIRDRTNTERIQIKVDELLERSWYMLWISGTMLPKYIEIFWLSIAEKSSMAQISDHYNDLLNDLEALTSSDSNRQEAALQNLQKRMNKSK